MNVFIYVKYFPLIMEDQFLGSRRITFCRGKDNYNVILNHVIGETCTTSIYFPNVANTQQRLPTWPEVNLINSNINHPAHKQMEFYWDYYQGTLWHEADLQRAPSSTYRSTFALSAYLYWTGIFIALVYVASCSSSFIHQRCPEVRDVI